MTEGSVLMRLCLIPSAIYCVIEEKPAIVLKFPIDKGGIFVRKIACWSQNVPHLPFLFLFIRNSSISLSDFHHLPASPHHFSFSTPNLSILTSNLILIFNTSPWMTADLFCLRSNLTCLRIAFRSSVSLPAGSKFLLPFSRQTKNWQTI